MIGYILCVPKSWHTVSLIYCMGPKTNKKAILLQRTTLQCRALLQKAWT